MQALYCCSGYINVTLTVSDQALMVFIVAMGPFTVILLRSFLFMISPNCPWMKQQITGAADPWVVNKHEKQSAFHLKAEWCSVLNLGDETREGGHLKNNEIIRNKLRCE